MDLSLIFIGVVPLLAFVIVDSFAGLKMGLVTAVSFAFLELIFSIYLFGMIDWVTGVSVGLVLVLSFVSWRFKSSLHFKLQPAILSGILGGIFLVSYWLNHPLLLSFVDKYSAELPASLRQQFQFPFMRQLITVFSYYLGYAFLAHAVLTAWSAFKLSNWWWILMRGIGFYFFQIVAFVAARLTVGH